MSSEESVTHWLNLLQAGDHAAVQKLWERYFQRLVGLARTKLQGTPRRVADEEDVALNAFDSFCRGAEAGRFPELQDRHGLWRLLVAITVRKAYRQVRDEQRQKRGGGVQGELEDLGEVLGREPTPELAAELAEEYQRLLACLSSDDLRAIALWKMEGYTTEEIAAKLDCAPSTIGRRLALIRQTWEEQERR